jgi:hypothetical protein
MASRRRARGNQSARHGDEKGCTSLNVVRALWHDHHDASREAEELLRDTAEKNVGNASRTLLFNNDHVGMFLFGEINDGLCDLAPRDSSTIVGAPILRARSLADFRTSADIDVSNSPGQAPSALLNWRNSATGKP